MSGSAAPFASLLLVLGIAVIASILVRSGLGRLGLPPLAGFMALGIVINLIDSRTGFLSGSTGTVFEFLANLGLVVLLFRIGLESNLEGILSQIRRASLVWTGDVLLSGFMGYAAARYLFGLGLVPSLFVAVSLTATSVGVSVSVWRDEGKLETKPGELLLDVAEMDDVSGIVLMALALSLAPVLNAGAAGPIEGIVLKTAGILLLKLVLFGLLCLLFSRYVERHVTACFAKLKRSPDPMLVVASFGIIIAAIAGLLGFSLAMGAFFAGLIFSRDPKAVKVDSMYGVLYDFLVPFFFIGIGLSVRLEGMASSLGLGAVLFAVAASAKLVGDGLLSIRFVGGAGALLIGISMVPRAEIALVIMQRGHTLGEWAVPDRVFGAMVLVSLGTCLLAPLVLKRLLKRGPAGTANGSKER